MAARAEQITGLVLAGGRGERRSGADKGWMQYRGRQMIEWVVERFRPQVCQLLIAETRTAAQHEPA